MTTGKRESIIAATSELFRSSHLVRKVSVEEIARKACVSPTTIYHYFGDRDSLVKEVAKRLVLAAIGRSRDLLHSPLSFAQKLQAIISGKVDLASNASDEIIEKMVTQDAEMAGFVGDVFRTELIPLWSEFLADGKSQGYIDPALDEEAFMIYLDVLRAGFGAKSELLKECRKDLRLLEKMTRLVFYGFLREDMNLFGDGGIARPLAPPEERPKEVRSG